MTRKYEDFANGRLHVSSRAGDEFMVQCMYHDDHNASLQFNVDSGLWICFTCKAAGNIKTLERKLGIRIHEAMIDVNDILARLDALKDPDADVLPLLDESYLREFEFPTKYWTEDRGFTPSTVAAFDLGYSPIGDKYGEFMTIPVRNFNGRLLGVIKRYCDKNAPFRYKEPKGYKKSHNLFGSWLAEQDPEAHTVALVEGPLDTAKVWQASHPALGLHGSSISAEQVRVLRRLGIRKIILFPDDDEAGDGMASTCMGWKKRERKGIVKWERDPMLDLRREFIVQRVWYPPGFPSDPGAMNTDQITQMLRNARSVF